MKFNETSMYNDILPTRKTCLIDENSSNFTTPPSHGIVSLVKLLGRRVRMDKPARFTLPPKPLATRMLPFSETLCRTCPQIQRPIHASLQET